MFKRLLKWIKVVVPIPAKRQRLAVDFETTTDPNDVRVWAGCGVDIDTLETAFIVNSIDAFFEWFSNKNTVAYFHNLKFDGEFIISYLLSHGYKHSKTRESKTFDTLITAEGAFYSITVIFERKKKQYKKVVFYDSLKKLPFKVSVISKAFNLPDEKLVIDYDAPRPIGHVLTEEEKAYIVNDCRIVANALQIQFGEGLKRMTNASDAMANYKDIFTEKRFNYHFPVLPVEIDTDIRRAYRGGYVYLKPEHENRRGLQGVTLDVNSLYPSVMYDEVLPWGYPMYFEGEPEPDENYPLYIVRIECAFDLKPGHLPTIQLKKNPSFVPTQYLTTSDGAIVPMTLTNVDLELLLDHYETHGTLKYFNGFKFKGKKGMFVEYIEYWMHIKETTTGALRQLAKLMLNSLYGRFALSPKATRKIPELDEEGIVRYSFTGENCHNEEYTEEEEREPVYIPMGAFITAYARNKTIRSAQKVYDRFIYADTDSLHLIGYEIPEELDVHPSKLGAWKNEGEFHDSKYIRAKTYMETTDEGTKVTCAGMPDNIKEQVTYDNFHIGSSFEGKLMPKRVKGGVVLLPTTFTIK